MQNIQWKNLLQKKGQLHEDAADVVAVSPETVAAAVTTSGVLLPGVQVLVQKAIPVHNDRAAEHGVDSKNPAVPNRKGQAPMVLPVKRQVMENRSKNVDLSEKRRGVSKASINRANSN